jgi:hypothetical protein
MEPEPIPAQVMEFEVSDLGYYLLSPRPIQVTGTLIGCEIHPSKGLLSKWKRLILRKTTLSSKSHADHGSTLMEWVGSAPASATSMLRDPTLASHIDIISEALRPFNPIRRELASIDFRGLEDLVGVTEDATGVRTRLVLKGTLEDKRDYLLENLLREVPITLRNAYLADGLFEMRGYDIQGFRPERVRRLVRFNRAGRARCAFLSANNRIDVQVPDMNRFRYVRIFDQAVRTDPEMANRLKECLQGDILPLKLFFNDRFSIAYSNQQLPSPFLDIFDGTDMKSDIREMVVHSLKKGQIGISFSYLPLKGRGRGKTYATVSVMHDIRAFEAVKKEAPTVYREIQSRAGVRGNIPYYLLESITGISGETSVQS